jgi:hypothetical protein
MEKILIDADKITLKDFSSWAGIASFESSGFDPEINIENGLFTNNDIGVFSRDSFVNIKIARFTAMQVWDF